jgi:pyruvate oxidase
VIVAGHGAYSGRSALIALAERLGAPVVTTFKAKGLVPDTHPLGAGVLGRSGTPVVSWLMNESDLLIVVGASFSNHTGVATYKPIGQIDDDHRAIGRFNPVTVGVLGDAGLTLTELLAGLETTAAAGQRADVAAGWRNALSQSDGSVARPPSQMWIYCYRSAVQHTVTGCWRLPGSRVATRRA